MKRLQAWMRVRSLRQVHIWWHWKHAEPGPNQFNVPVGAEIYWHVELKDFEPLEDHGQRQQRGSWSKTEHVYTGYDHDLNRAITKALRVARDSPGVKDAEYEMNIEQIARISHETNRAYCESIGDNSQPKWEDAPEWHRSSAINGVKFHIEHPNALASASHDAWLAEKREAGWKYGPVPYDGLPIEQRLKDYLSTAVAEAFVKCEKLG